MTFDQRIAIVGMHLKLPAGVDGCEELWRLLVDGRDVFARGAVDGRHVPVTSRIADTDLFAAEQFGITDFEAGLMDPQHRMLLELSWECLESVGPGKEAVTGVFSTCSSSSFFQQVLLNRPELWARSERQLLEGSAGDFVASRIAYRLGLTGPAVHVGSACSSSLMALNLAINSLNEFECDRALVAAASIDSAEAAGYEYVDGSIYSPDGYCRPFSDDAAGSVPGSGAVVILLKRLEDAIADNDYVHAVILGSAANNDGNRKVGFSAPSVDGQAECISAALDRAEVEPAEVGYIEAHGTGTRVGDPIELRAISRAYGPAAPGSGRYVGSVKANIGHCDVAAGLFGLVKAAMMLDKRQIPPQINVAVPTTEYDWSEGSLELTRVPVDFAPAAFGPEAPLTAGVSSLGVGGTNVHVILRDARSILGARELSRRPVGPIVRVSGRKSYNSLAAAPPSPPPTQPAAPKREPAVVAVPVSDEELFEKFSEHTTEPVTSVDDDFFDLGGDSLGAIYLLDELNALTDREITVEAFTLTPTVAWVKAQLAAAGPDPAEDAETGAATASEDTEAAIAAEVTDRLGRIRPAISASHGDLVLLTGASGFVGSFVLANLLASGTRVACLLRGGAERRAELVRRLGELGLWHDDYAGRLEFTAGDVAAPDRLGMDDAAYDELAERAGRIVHCAAWVNHLYPYRQLAEANAHSAAGILELAVTGSRKQVTLVSTGAVFGSSAYQPGTEIAAGALTALPPERDGYSCSKAVAEAYFARADEVGASAAVVRIPNIFGDRTRFQINPTDSVWSLTKAIILTGRYPSSYDAPGNELFQALPADVAAGVIVELGRPDGSPGCRFVNALPNLVCTTRNYVAGIQEAGHDVWPLADQEWYELAGALNSREVWVAGVAGRRALRSDAAAASRLHRFALDENPEVSEAVNAHAIWSPRNLANYVMSLR